MGFGGPNSEAKIHGGVRTEDRSVGRRDGGDEIGAGEERRSDGLGGSAELEPWLGGNGDSVAGACSSSRLPHLLGQPRSSGVEVSGEGLGYQDRPSHARPRSSLHQVTDSTSFFLFNAGSR